MIKLVRRCPFCNDISVDYNHNLKIWKCLWIYCNYTRKKNKNEKNPLQITILEGHNSNYDNEISYDSDGNEIIIKKEQKRFDIKKRL